MSLIIIESPYILLKKIYFANMKIYEYIMYVNVSIVLRNNLKTLASPVPSCPSPPEEYEVLYNTGIITNNNMISMELIISVVIILCEFEFTHYKVPTMVPGCITCDQNPGVGEVIRAEVT